jgi:hypothetical protein
MSVQQARKTPLAVYLWRFAAGHPIDGRRRTNYTFRHRATRDLTDHGHSSRWAHRAGWERAAIRVVFAAVTLAILYGYLTDRTVTVDACMGALFGACVGLAVRARFVIRSSRHHRRVVRPMYQAMSQVIGGTAITAHSQAYGDSHKRYIRVPVNYRDPKTRIKYMVPVTWEGDSGSLRRLNAIVAKRLGGDWDVMHHASAWPPYVEFMPSPAPPKSVGFADIAAAIERASDSEIIIGIGTHNRKISIDLDSESPHVAMSIGTGGGKSSLLRLIVIQLIRHGCERIDIIDPKRISHDWAKDIPGVYIHRTMPKQIEAVSDFRKRMEDRYEALENGAPANFPRHALLIEEQNSFMDYAKTYWEDYRNELDKEERAKTPKRPPVIGDIGYILFQGRQAKMNVFSVFQQMNARAAGGSDLRVNYGAKILARFGQGEWMMLVGTRPIPRSSRINGRGRIALGDEDREVQFAFISEEEATGYGMRCAAPAPAEFNPITDVPADGAGADDAGEMMTLRELVEAGVIPVRYSAATRARTRAGDAFPKGKRTPIGIAYEPAVIQEFFTSRSGRHSK